MFIFDATTVAIMLPSTVLWILLIAAHSHKKLNYSLSHQISYPDLLQMKKPKNILGIFSPTQHVRAQIKIYALCLSLSGVCLWVLNFLNPLRAPISIAADTFLFAVLTMVGSVLLSIIAVLPLFYGLQIEFSKRFLCSSNLQLSKVEHIFLFCTIALYLLPICEAIRASAGISSVPIWLAKNIYRVSLALSTLPLSMWGMVIAFKPIFWGRDFKGIKSDQILANVEFLKDKNFDETLLEYKTDAEINCIIKIAKQLGSYDKAEIASECLMKRYDSAPEVRS